MFVYVWTASQSDRSYQREVFFVTPGPIQTQPFLMNTSAGTSAAGSQSGPESPIGKKPSGDSISICLPSDPFKATYTNGVNGKGKSRHHDSPEDARAEASRLYAKASSLDNEYCSLGAVVLADYKKAAAAGSPEAMLALGKAHKFGFLGLPRDEEGHETIQYLRPAAEAGNPEAQALYGRMHEQGSGGLPKSDEEARRWYEEAAKVGNGGGEYYLAGLQRYGHGGLAPDLGKAIELLTRADMHGVPEAKTYLLALKLELNALSKNTATAKSSRFQRMKLAISPTRFMSPTKGTTPTEITHPIR
jgi:hypothetical protein